jgi:hypothetical protein
MDYVREDQCEVCERVRRGPDECPARASQYDDVRMRCESPGRTGSTRERRSVSAECRTESYSSRRIGEYLHSGGAFPTAGYKEVPRDIDVDFDLPQNAFEGGSDGPVYGLDNDAEADSPNDSGLDQPPLSPGFNRQSETQSDDVVPPHITRSYHPNINGAWFPSIFRPNYTNCSTHKGRICDEQGNDIPLDTRPPPCPSGRGPADWTPYTDRVEFEVTDFLYRRNQMSGGDIDFIFSLWAASLAPHSDTPPFANHIDMYDAIDSTPLGDVPWQSFSSQYNGTLPEGDVPPEWMTSKYDVWFRDPRLLIHNIISNPDFKDEFDYAPVQEYSNGAHRFQDFMSGDWCWKQAVSVTRRFFFLSLYSQDLIAQDPDTIGSMFIPIILGSDKTTVSVATGHNQYWPVYMSIGNIHNNVRRAHRNGVVLLGFLAIPTSSYLVLSVAITSSTNQI